MVSWPVLATAVWVSSLSTQGGQWDVHIDKKGVPAQRSIEKQVQGRRRLQEWRREKLEFKVKPCWSRHVSVLSPCICTFLPFLFFPLRFLFNFIPLREKERQSTSRGSGRGRRLPLNHLSDPGALHPYFSGAVSFPRAYGHLYLLFGEKHRFKSAAQFFIGLFVFLLSSVRVSVESGYADSYQMRFTNMWSRSAGRLFTFLMVSLGWMRRVSKSVPVQCFPLLLVL